jgi:transposase-like protein
VRDSTVRVKAVYLALGINLAGEKEILDWWIVQSEGAKFWVWAFDQAFMGWLGLGGLR